jgi:hypothetical protein
METPGNKIITHRWETWPFNLVYFPMLFVWLYYIIRSRAVWFFTPSNPAITFGGMQGETKSEMYARLQPGFYPTTVVVQPTDRFEEVLSKAAQQQLVFPFVVKPEIGEAGILFRKIDNAIQLQEYHGKVQLPYLLQALVHYPIEVSVFYYRMPAEKKGTITGFLHKVPLQVVGDGVSTLQQLINHHSKAKDYLSDIEKVHAGQFGQVVEKGQVYKLSYAANHRRGARFYNLGKEIDAKLLAVFDNISNCTDGWYYGRYDVMCRSIADLKAGRHFCILEYNGCGAEPNHIYDSGYTLWQAYREIVRHWSALYRISRYNAKRNGIKPWPLIKGLRFVRQARTKVKTAERIDRQLSF